MCNIKIYVSPPHLPACFTKKNEWAFFFWKSLPQYLKTIFDVLSWSLHGKRILNSCFCVSVFIRRLQCLLKLKLYYLKRMNEPSFFWKSLPQYLKVIFYILKPPWKKNNKQPFSSVKQLLFLFFVFPGRLRCLLKLKLYYQKEWMTVCFLFFHR